MKSTRQHSIIVILAMIFGFLIFAPLPATAAEIFIDNGGPGTSSDGLWAPSGGQNSYGRTSVYNKTEEGGTYSFEADVSGSCEVSLWWTYYDNRHTSVPVEIYDGNSLLDTVYVDQLQNGGQWNGVGTYDFNGTARVVIHSVGGALISTCADGVKLVIEDKPKCGMDKAAYDSGWIDADGFDGKNYRIVHALGGNPHDYVVDLTRGVKQSDGEDGTWIYNNNNNNVDGMYWHNLNHNEVSVYVHEYANYWEQFRVRIFMLCQ